MKNKIEKEKVRINKISFIMESLENINEEISEKCFSNYDDEMFRFFKEVHWKGLNRESIDFIEDVLTISKDFYIDTIYNNLKKEFKKLKQE